jgi:NADH-quinone oxidoreductase subunit D
MSGASLAETVGARFPNAQIRQERDGATLTIEPAHLVEACEFLRDEAEASYDLLLTLAVAGEYALYQLASHVRRTRMRVRVPLGGISPIPRSVSVVWPAADWAEREAHDLWDITFGGRSDLAPLLAQSAMDYLSPTQEDNAKRALSGTRYPTSVDGLSITVEREGERVVRASPNLGYRHSGLERQLTEWAYPRGTLLAARMDGFSAMTCDLAFSLAVDRLLGLQPPPRAQVLRVVYAELQRIASHLFWLAHLSQSLTDPPFAASAYAWQGRTAILDLFQRMGGNPLAPDVITIGGLGRDTPPAFEDALRTLMAELQTLLDDLDRLLSHNAGFRAQLYGCGVIDVGTALGLGVTGPCLRACGTGYDVRRTFPYADYGSLDLDIPVRQGCDADARYQVRVAEMRASLRLIRQCISRLAPGLVNALALGQALPELPDGTAYASVEGPRGEVGVLIVAKEGMRPKHVRVRGPSFANLSALPLLSRGVSIDRLGTILDSLDISMGEVER